MVWFRVDDTLSAHPKARAAGLPAMGLWSLAGAYAAQYLTEGYVPEWYVLTWTSGRKHADRLVAVGLWEVAPGGWQFHQWAERQPSKAQVEAEREKTRKRQQKWRDEHRDDDPSNAVTNGVTNGSEKPFVTGAPTLPIPTHPLSTSVEVEKRGDRQAALPASADTIPPQFQQCPAHRGLPKDQIPPCDGCRASREKTTTTVETSVAAEQLTRRLAIDACTHCDDNGLTDDEQPARCSHLKGNAA